MDVNTYLLAGLIFAVLVILYLALRLGRVWHQLSFIKEALEDLKHGNLNRRVLAGENDMTKQICYDINDIAISGQSQLFSRGRRNRRISAL